jgi:clan AA aspartic protease
MNGEVDVSGRALIVLSIRPSHGADAVSLQAWVDTAFTGELVIPQATITRLGLPQSAAVMAGLADGTQVVLDTFSCVIDWFGRERVVEVVENDGNLPLLGVGLLWERKLEIDYPARTLSLA